MIEIITGKDNKKLKILASLSAKKGREKHGAYLVEGKRMVAEAAEYADVRFVVASETFYEDNRSLVDGIAAKGISVFKTSDRLFLGVADTKTPQGIAAAVSLPPKEDFDPEKARKALVLDGVSEPGNMGTIIRTAEAAGIDWIFLMKGCADVYNPKVVRSTMGSVFRMKFTYCEKSDELGVLKENGFKLISSALKNSVDIHEYKNGGEKTAVVIGSEAFGVSREVLAMSDILVRIPMSGKVESLNAAVAAGILMYSL